MNMSEPSLLYDMRDCEESTPNCTSMCPCVFKGQDAVAVFTGTALHVHYSSKEAQDTPLVSHIAGMREAAGTLDGPGWLARFRGVVGMTYVPTTNKLIVCDCTGRTLRSVHLESPFTVSTLCGRTTLSGEYVDTTLRHSLFDSPYNVCVAPNGVDVYVSDYGNHAVRKIDMRNETVVTIFGCGAQTTYAGAPVDQFKCTLMYPMGLKMDCTGKLLYVVNFACNSICELQVHPKNEKEGRLVRAFAIQRAKNALPTVIDVTPSGHVIVWRENEGLTVDDPFAPDSWSGHASNIALYDARSGIILFKMDAAYTPRAFFMRFPSKQNAVNGTVVHALRSKGGGITCALMKTSMTLNGRVMKLLLSNVQKTDATHSLWAGTASMFAVIPLSILLYIIELANNPFLVAIHK
jgi:hypothetical protein